MDQPADKGLEEDQRVLQPAWGWQAARGANTSFRSGGREKTPPNSRFLWISSISILFSRGLKSPEAPAAEGALHAGAVNHVSVLAKGLALRVQISANLGKRGTAPRHRAVPPVPPHLDPHPFVLKTKPWYH